MAIAANDSKTTPLNKMIAIGIAVFGLIEAVITYFLVISPLYVKPVYDQAAAYSNEGKNCIVKLFGKTFASEQEIAENQIILSFMDTLINIILVYIVITGIMLLLAFCFYKGFAFARTYLTWVFAGKTVIGLVPMLIPFANIRNSMRIFGVIDAVICLAACVYFTYLSIEEYADDMLISSAPLKRRGIESGAMFLALTVGIIFESYGMGGLGGGAWSIYLGWLEGTEIAQGIVLAVLAAVGIVAAITSTREMDWGDFFFFAFSAVAAVSNIIGIVNKVSSVGGFTKSLILIVIATVCFAAVAVFSFMKIKSKVIVKITPDDKKTVFALLISVASILLSFVFTIIAVTMLDKVTYGGNPLGAMDFMYFIVYGGITLFLASAMLGGYGFTKFGALAMYVVVGSMNFESIFVVLNLRKGFIAANPGMVGYNYIISAVMFILSIVFCFGIIPAFAVKNVGDYMYKKRYS